MLFIKSGFSAICLVNSSNVCRCGSIVGFVSNSISCVREVPFMSSVCLSGTSLFCCGCNGGNSVLSVLFLVGLLVFHAGLLGSMGGNVLLVCLTVVLCVFLITF